jgi:hypothetical protein
VHPEGIQSPAATIPVSSVYPLIRLIILAMPILFCKSFEFPLIFCLFLQKTQKTELAAPKAANALELADLVFDPTLACWNFRYRELTSHYSSSRIKRQD